MLEVPGWGVETTVTGRSLQRGYIPLTFGLRPELSHTSPLSLLKHCDQYAIWGSGDPP